MPWRLGVTFMFTTLPDSKREVIVQRSLFKHRRPRESSCDRFLSTKFSICSLIRLSFRLITLSRSGKFKRFPWVYLCSGPLCNILRLGYIGTRQSRPLFEEYMAQNGPISSQQYVQHISWCLGSKYNGPNLILIFYGPVFQF